MHCHCCCPTLLLGLTGKERSYLRAHGSLACHGLLGLPGLSVATGHAPVRALMHLEELPDLQSSVYALLGGGGVQMMGSREVWRGPICRKWYIPLSPD